MIKMISEEDLGRLMDTKLKLPRSIDVRDEFLSLYQVKTGRISEDSVYQTIKRAYKEGRPEDVVIVLKAIAERGIREYQRQFEQYPSMKQEFEARIKDLQDFLTALKD